MFSPSRISGLHINETCFQPPPHLLQKHSSAFSSSSISRLSIWKSSFSIVVILRTSYSQNSNRRKGENHLGFSLNSIITIKKKNQKPKLFFFSNYYILFIEQVKMGVLSNFIYSYYILSFYLNLEHKGIYNPSQSEKIDPYTKREKWFFKSQNTQKRKNKLDRTVN